MQFSLLDTPPVHPQKRVLSRSCRDRFELLPHQNWSHWVCRWFENHQRRLSAAPAVKTAQRRLRYIFLGFANTAERLWCWQIAYIMHLCIPQDYHYRKMHHSVFHVPGSWKWCRLPGLHTQSCLLSPPGRFCLPQQIFASQRSCRWLWSPNPPSFHMLHLCLHSRSHTWAKCKE